MTVGIAGPASAHVPDFYIDHDGVAAGSPGSQIYGSLYWTDFAGRVHWHIRLRDTTPYNGVCAKLYIRQRPVSGAVVSGWTLAATRCVAGEVWVSLGVNVPFQGGTGYFDFKVAGEYAAYDYNRLGYG